MKPIVSVVTPFYNTERDLAECIESVLSQTFTDFEYILVNNQSTDQSAQIAAYYAKKDSRIRLANTNEFLGQVENYNFALSLIDPGSKYCKIVQADDWIFSNCLTAMVELAERDSKIGIVSSYGLRGKSLRGEGLDVWQWRIPGLEAGRMQLLDRVFFVGSPTTVMYRSSIVRSRHPFYALNRYHEDTEAAYEILIQHDLGFVHQVLSYQRVDDSSIMGQRRSFQPHLLDNLIATELYGRHFLSEPEFKYVRQRTEQRLIRFLGTSLLQLREKSFWQYQSNGYTTINQKLPWRRIALSASDQFFDLLLNPKSTIERIIHKILRRFQ